MNRGLTFTCGAVVGAGLMYLLDPDRGKRHRALTRDKIVHLAHETGNAFDATSHDIANRTQGLIAETRILFLDEPVSDEVLVQRVRSKMGRVVSHPHSIVVTADEGRISVSGPILKHEEIPLLAAISSVPGVTNVSNELEAHDLRGNIPALQGGVYRSGARIEWLHENWSPAARLTACISGAVLTYTGMKRQGMSGTALSTIGLGLFTRGATNMSWRRLLGYGDHDRAVDIHKTINVNAPIEDVYALWTDFEEYPRFMEHVQEVRLSDRDRLHWVIVGPAGVPVHWDAEIIQQIPNEVLSWKSLPGEAVAQSGVTHFAQNPDGTTRVDISMSYNPPAGAIGHVVATIFGVDPKRSMDEDLVRFQSLLERGKTTAHGSAVNREDLDLTSNEPATPHDPGTMVGE